MIRKNKLKLFLGVIACLAILAGEGLAQNAKDIVKNVRKKYEKLASFEADFVQTSVWALAGEEQKEGGRLALGEKNKYRIETDTQLIISDGNRVWTYSKERNQVILDLLTKSKEHQLPKDILLKYTENSRVELLGESVIGGTPCFELKFTPKDEDAFIMSTKLWVDKNKLVTLRIEQEDINENITRYDLEKIKMNPPLENALFSFTIPADAEVIDLSDLNK